MIMQHNHLTVEGLANCEECVRRAQNRPGSQGATSMTVRQLCRQAGLAEAVKLAHVYAIDETPRQIDLFTMAEAFARYIETGETK
jgi:hypothetical protein